MKALIVFLTVLGTQLSVYASEVKLKDACKIDCSQAKTDDEAHACAEKIEHSKKAFKDPKCDQANKKFETARGDHHEE